VTVDRELFVERVRLDQTQVRAERARIVSFLRAKLGGEPAVCAVSGGLDSDVTTRLVVEAIGPSRSKVFIVRQDDFDPRFLEHAQQLAADLKVELTTIDLRGFPRRIVEALHVADESMSFRPDGLLDVGRAKCSLRTVVLSTYQDRGFRVIGNSNRTEWLTGFFLPFGDGLAHLQPIIHLYKSQVAQLAELVGTARAVIDQPGSSGFWLGAEDLLDLSFWLQAGGPIRRERSYSEEELAEVRSVRELLDRQVLDALIDALREGQDEKRVSAASGLPRALVGRVRSLLDAASWKHVPMFERVAVP
jgi:NAD+ synthase